MTICFDGAFEYGDGGMLKLLGGCKNCTNHRGTMNVLMLTDFQMMDNF
jgi:hypothetical protein